MQTLRKNG